MDTKLKRQLKIVKQKTHDKKYIFSIFTSGKALEEKFNTYNIKKIFKLFYIILVA